VAAKICDFTNCTYFGVYEAVLVQNQTDLDSKINGCDTIIGGIFIAPNYTGPFVLSNVSNITASICTNGTPCGNSGDRDETETTPLLTSVQSNSLTSLGGSFELSGVPALKYISMPYLGFVDDIIISSNPELSISFPLVKNLTWLQILGGFSRYPTLMFVLKSCQQLTFYSMDFTQLVGTESYLSISNDNTSASAAYEANGLGGPDIDFIPYSATGAQYTPLDINFPSLTNVSYLNLWGNISRLVAPLD
jgi:hypothetical protein